MKEYFLVDLCIFYMYFLLLMILFKSIKRKLIGNKEKSFHKNILLLIRINGGEPYKEKTFQIKKFTKDDLYKKIIYIEDEKKFMGWDKEITNNSFKEPTLVHQYRLDQKNKLMFEKILYLPKNNIF